MLSPRDLLVLSCRSVVAHACTDDCASVCALAALGSHLQARRWPVPLVTISSCSKGFSTVWQLRCERWLTKYWACVRMLSHQKPREPLLTRPSPYDPTPMPLLIFFSGAVSSVPHV